MDNCATDGSRFGAPGQERLNRKHSANECETGEEFERGVHCGVAVQPLPFYSSVFDTPPSLIHYSP